MNFAEQVASCWTSGPAICGFIDGVDDYHLGLIPGWAAVLAGEYADNYREGLIAASRVTAWDRNFTGQA